VLQNRCSVYESNAAALGKIDNPELLKRIVSVYGQIKALLDQMNLNYQRFVSFTDVLRKQDRGLQIQGTELQAAVAELTEIRENMERGLGTLMDDLNSLLEDLRTYKANST
jgi:ABC-type phosphate transport system auxiliary subunit